MAQVEVRVEAETQGAVRGLSGVRSEIEGASRAAGGAARPFGQMNEKFADLGKAGPGAGRALSQVEQGAAQAARAAGLSATQTRILTIAVRTLTGALGPVTLAIGAVAAGLALFTRAKERARERAEQLAESQERLAAGAISWQQAIRDMEVASSDYSQRLTDVRLRILDVIDAERAREMRSQSVSDTLAAAGLRQIETEREYEATVEDVDRVLEDAKRRQIALHEEFQRVLVRARAASQSFGEAERQQGLERLRSAARELSAAQALVERYRAMSEALESVSGHYTDMANEAARSARESQAAREAAGARAAAEAARRLADQEREYQQILQQRERHVEANLRAAQGAQRIALASLAEEEQIEFRRARLAREGIEEVADLRRFASQATIRLMMAETDEQRAQIERQLEDYQAVIASRERAEMNLADQRMMALRSVDTLAEQMLDEETRRQQMLLELGVASLHEQLDVEREFYEIRRELAVAEEEEEIERLERRAALLSEFRRQQVDLEREAADEELRVREAAERRRMMLIERASSTAASAVMEAADLGVRSALRTVGGQLQAEGIQRTLQALAMSVFNPGAASTLGAAGAAMTAAGTAMRSAAGGGGRGVPGGTAAPGASGGGEAQPRGPVNINISEGLVSDPQRTAQAVGEAVRDAQSRGLL